MVSATARSRLGPDAGDIDRFAKLLIEAKHPGIFAYWDAHNATQELAEWQGAPTATTLQDISAFRANHPLHAGLGFGGCAVSPADCLPYKYR